MSRTLNDLIATAISGAEEIEESSSSPEPKKEPKTPAATTAESDHEKLASVLEFLGRRGVENLLKEASGVHTPATAPPPGTNLVQAQQGKKATHSLEGPNKHSPPMKSAPVGKVENNASQKPGAGAGAPDTSSTQKGDHHPALASNEAAINADKKIKSKIVTPAIQKVVDAPAGSIHKSAHDLTAVRAELARRAAAAQAEGSAS